MINKGSEWRLWNLHMHSKYSLEKRTKMSIKEIFDKLIQNNISMFSITDHSNVDALDEIWDVYENQSNEKGAYKDQINFIPGIEVKTDKGKKGVHMICVFPELIKINGCYVKADKQNIYDNFCSPLGLTKSKITANGKNDYAAGLLSSVVNLDNAVELTHKLGGLVIVHGGDKHGSVDKEMKDAPTMTPTPEQIYEYLDITKGEILEKKIDVIELPNFEKRQAKNAQFYRDTFGKPCMVASDSHERKDYEDMQSRCTWVKADCSFEGLRQALIDYDNRIFLGVVPEQVGRINKNPTKYIDKLKIDWTEAYDGNKGKWFKNISIPLNPGLISIIGNKGNGKSAIAEVIGLLADSHNYDNFAFLNRNKFLKNKLATNFEATLIWKNNMESITKNLSETPDENSVERCQCIPQQYFDEICTDTELKRFSDEINNVIFSRLSDIDKEYCRNFDELLDKYTKTTESNIDFLINDLTNVNRDIIDKEEKQLSSYKQKQEALLKDANSKLEAHDSIKPKSVEKPVLPKEKQEIYDDIINNISDLTAKKEEETQNLRELTQKARKIKNILDEIDEIQNRFEKTMERMKDELSEFELDCKSIIELKIDKSNLILKKDEIDKLIEDSKNKLENPENGIVAKLEKYTRDKNDIVLEEDKLVQEYNEYTNRLKEWDEEKRKLSDNVKVIEEELEYITGKIQEDLNLLYMKRNEISSGILEEKKKIIQIYNKFKKPVDEFLNENNELLNDYSVYIRSGIVVDTLFQQRFFDYINKQKRNIFKEDNYQLYKTIEDIGEFEKIDEYVDIPVKIVEKMQAFPDGIIPQIKENRLLDFYNFLFGLGYLDNKYELVSDNKTLDKLSPGERGALLLIFYLLLDLRDIPLIIDQPEDNLDNQSVAKVLVPFIQAAKTRRQIILVTHNPNLAVVADSDQIIHVVIDKEDEQLVKIEAGGIEDSKINDAIVTILEGTMSSFQKRERKYIVN